MYLSQMTGKSTSGLRVSCLSLCQRNHDQSK
jgi:hypothetical protein